MSSGRFVVAITIALLLSSRGAFAQTLTVAGVPALLRVNSAVAGSQPLAVSNGTTTYTVTTPNPSRTYAITAQINTAMPPGITLTATLAAPPGATSLGAVALDGTARNLVTNIPRNTNATRSITYQLIATVAGGVIPLSARTVTFTIIRFP